MAGALVLQIGTPQTRLVCGGCMSSYSGTNIGLFHPPSDQPGLSFDKTRLAFTLSRSWNFASFLRCYTESLDLFVHESPGFSEMFSLVVVASGGSWFPSFHFNYFACFCLYSFLSESSFRSHCVFIVIIMECE